jgi:hypothetical protein
MASIIDDFLPIIEKFTWVSACYYMRYNKVEFAGTTRGPGPRGHPEDVDETPAQVWSPKLLWL